MTELSLIEHGTLSGWNMHMRRRIPLCPDCTAAKSRYTRDYRRSRLVGTYRWPLVMRPDLVGSSFVGAVLAESFRGSA